MKKILIALLFTSMIHTSPTPDPIQEDDQPTTPAPSSTTNQNTQSLSPEALTDEQNKNLQSYWNFEKCANSLHVISTLTQHKNHSQLHHAIVEHLINVLDQPECMIFKEYYEAQRALKKSDKKYITAFNEWITQHQNDANTELRTFIQSIGIDVKEEEIATGLLFSPKS